MSRTVIVTAAILASLTALPAPAGARGKPSRAAVRAQLKREVERNPQAVLKPAFLHKAGAVDFNLPIAIRLSGGGLAVELDYDQLSVPVLGSQPPPVATTTVGGSIGGVARFGADTSGYGDPGTVELVQQDAAPTGPQRLTGSALALLAGPACVMDTGPLRFNLRQTFGTMNFFTGRYRGNLRLVPSFTTTPAPGCATFASQDAASAPPLPIALNGRFRISPAILPDGRVRFGVLSIDAPQEDNHGEVRSCVPPSAGGVASPLCPAGTNLVTLTARVKATSFTADLLLGHA